MSNRSIDTESVSKLVSDSTKYPLRQQNQRPSDEAQKTMKHVTLFEIEEVKQQKGDRVAK